MSPPCTNSVSVIAVFSGDYINTSWLTGSTAIWAGRTCSKKKTESFASIVKCLSVRPVNTCTGIAFKMWSNINRKTFTAAIVCRLIIVVELGNASIVTHDRLYRYQRGDIHARRDEGYTDSKISIISKITFIISAEGCVQLEYKLVIMKITFRSLDIIIFQYIPTYSLNYDWNFLFLIVIALNVTSLQRIRIQFPTFCSVWPCARFRTRVYKIVPLLQLTRLGFIELIVWKMKVDAQIIIRRIPHVLRRIDNSSAYGTIHTTACHVLLNKKKYKTRQMYEYHVREYRVDPNIQLSCSI